MFDTLLTRLWSFLSNRQQVDNPAPKEGYLGTGTSVTDTDADPSLLTITSPPVLVIGSGLFEVSTNVRFPLITVTNYNHETGMVEVMYNSANGEHCVTDVDSTFFNTFFEEHIVA